MAKTVNKWCLIKDSGKWTIRRWVRVDGTYKLERYPIAKYRDIRENETELKLLLIRINFQVEEVRRKKAVEIKHAFISPQLRDSFREYLIAQSTSEKSANNECFYVEHYFLNFFVNEMKLPDPVSWHKVHKTAWANYLLKHPTVRASQTKKHVIQSANKFMEWLHDQRPAEVPPLKFNPFSRARYKDIDAKRKLKEETLVHKYIVDTDWVKISKALPTDIGPAIHLAYSFGLRRAECLGLVLTDVKTNCILLQRQLVRFNGKPTYGPLKGKSVREIPYWTSTPDEAYQWISELKLMHYRTLSKKWDLCLEKLGLDYTLHDLRHTWISKVIKTQRIPRDVQLAAGHISLETTMCYVHEMEKEISSVFIPKKSG